jgi:hypothetical protein
MPFDATSGGASGGGPFDVGSAKVLYPAQAANLALTAADLGKTLIIDATTEIDVTLPAANAGGITVGADKLGIYSIGGPVNLRTSGGRLLLRFIGRANAANAVRPNVNGPVGCKLDLIDVSTARGKWIPRISNGTVYAPRQVSDYLSTTGTANVQHGLIGGGDPGGNLAGQNSPGVVPRQHRDCAAWLSSGQFFKISETQVLRVYRGNSATGNFVQVWTIDANGTWAEGNVQTLDAFDNSSALVCCVMAQNDAGYDYVLIGFYTSATVFKFRVIQITAGTNTIFALGAAQTLPAADNNGKTIETRPINSSRSTCLVGKSATQAYFIYGALNTTDTLNQSFAMLITRAGTGLTLSTPQRIDTGASNKTCNRIQAFIPGNVADRLVVWTTAGTNEWGGDNTNINVAVVLNTSTAAAPALAYRVPASSLPINQAAAGHTSYSDLWDPSVDYLYISQSQNSPGSYGSNIAWKMQFAAGAISGLTCAGEFQIARSEIGGAGLNNTLPGPGNGLVFHFPNGSVEGPFNYLNVTTSDTQIITVRFDGAFNSFDSPYQTNEPALGATVHQQFHAPLKPTHTRHRMVMNKTNKKVLGSVTNITYPIPMRSGAYWFFAPILPTGMNGQTTADTIGITLEIPDAA